MVAHSPDGVADTYISKLNLCEGASTPGFNPGFLFYNWNMAPSKRLIMLCLSLSASAVAAADSWVMSIPYALSEEHVYKVRIERIDGADVANALRYPLAAGEHTVTVSPVLDVEWSPDLVGNAGESPRSKDLKLTVEQGNTYRLAVKVDVDAGLESQLDQSFWSPYVYAVLEE